MDIEALQLGSRLVFSFGEAAAAGITTEHIATRVRRRQWARVYPRVYAVTTGPLPGPCRVEAALLYVGQPAAASHFTAARLLGLDTPESADMHVLIPHERRVARQPGLVVHRSRTFGESDVRLHRGLAVTTVERTVIDCVTLLGSGAAARALAASAIRERLTVVRRVTETAERLDVLRWGWIRELLADLSGGSQSELELIFLELCRRYGLPAPERQRRVGPFHVDAVIGPVLVELDGRRFHLDPDRWEHDLWRQNELMASGRVVLRFTWRMVRDEPARVAARIRRAIQDTAAGDPQQPMRRLGIPSRRGRRLE